MSAKASRNVGALAVIAAMLGSAPSLARAEDGNPGGERQALDRAVRLVPLAPGVRVVLIDPDLAPDPAPLRRLDAFVVREPSGALRPVIYVNHRSEIVQQAAAGSDFHVKVLAAVIHHEAQHLAGASELEARRSELAFFQTLVASGQVPCSVGRRYLQLLAQHAGGSSP